MKYVISFASEPQFFIYKSDIFINYKKFIQENEFDNYKTNKRSYKIRCIINFFKDETDLIII